MSLDITAFFHGASYTYSYVVADTAARRAAAIDPALDYDAASGRSGTKSAQAIVDHLKARGYTLDWILETHAHADHLTAAQFLRRELGGKVGIGAGIRAVQATFKTLYDLGDDFHDRRQPVRHAVRRWREFQDRRDPGAGGGHGGAHQRRRGLLVEDAAFVGDSLFMPDSGSARCDFPGGDAGKLYDSVRRLLDLPEATRLFMCHDYAPGGREHRNETSVGEERQTNIHVKDGVSREDFIKLRQGRDATLPVPALLLPAIQVNIRAGRFPEPEANGTVYLKIPVDRF